MHLLEKRISTLNYPPTLFYILPPQTAQSFMRDVSLQWPKSAENYFLKKEKSEYFGFSFYTQII